MSLEVETEKKLLHPLRAIPNDKQVAKITKELEYYRGLSNIQKLDMITGEIRTFRDGYNIATLAKAFFPKSIEVVNVKIGNEFEGWLLPTYQAMREMKRVISDFRRTYESRRVVLYPMRGQKEDGSGYEWRYFNMQKLEEYDPIAKLEDAIIKSIRKWIKCVSNILSENPEYRNEAHVKQVSEVRYEMALKRRELQRLERKKKRVLTTDGETESNETDEK